MEGFKVSNLIKRGQKGFTLVEIMIVLVILGLLIAVALPKVSQVLSTGKVNATRTSMSSLAKAIKSFNADTSVWPGNISDLIVPIAAAKPCYNTKTLAAATYTAVQVKNWKGPYMDGTTNEISVDAWGAKVALGVVDPTSYAFAGKDINDAAVSVTNSKDCNAFNEIGAVPGLYLHSPGDDTVTSNAANAKDDIFVYVSGKVQ